MSARLTVWDGAGVIGGNKVLLEADGRAIFFDFGTAFATMDRYFDEFLQGRANRGLLDLVELDILPPLDGIYRPDLYPPDGVVEERMRRKPDHRALEVHAVLATHAHIDHNGAIASLREDIPIHCSPMTAFISKAMQDCGGIYPGDIAYLRPKRADRGLLRTDDKAPVRQRPHVFATADWSAPAEAFWSRRESRQTFGTLAPRLSAQDVAGLPYRAFGVDHSVLGSTAFAVQTSAGWIAYTGDLRLHGRYGDITRRFAETLSALRPRLLITEGTHLGDQPSGTEQRVRERALEVVRAAPGFVAADFQPRHVERLLTFRDVARETGRKLAVLVKDAYLLEAMHAIDPAVPTVEADEALALYVRGKLSASRWERAVLQQLAGRRVDAAEVRAHPEGYVLALSFYELAELVEIDPPAGGVWIHSTSEAFDEEGRVNWRRLQQWLAHFGVRLVGDWERARDGDPEHAGLHASGHVSGSELAALVELIRPDLVVPVHTEQPEWFRRFEGRMRVELPQRGRPIEIAP
jgi:ribonuclease J